MAVVYNRYEVGSIVPRKKRESSEAWMMVVMGAGTGIGGKVRDQSQGGLKRGG